MHKLHVAALANAIALVDIIANGLFTVWLTYWPDAYMRTLHSLVMGLQMQMGPDTRFVLSEFLRDAILEAAGFWVLGAGIAFFYNWFAFRGEQRL